MTDQVADKPSLPSLKIVDVDWGSLEPGVAAYANNLLSLFDGQSVHVIFAQANPPIIYGKDETERLAQLDKVTSLAVSPVARLVIPLENFRAMLRALQDQLIKIDELIKKP
jgi:hypothetical protein